MIYGDKITPEYKEELKQAALEWCNKMRAEKGLEPLSELPKGRMGDPFSCPCGEATGLWVVSSFWDDARAGIHGIGAGSVPPKVGDFVIAFDSGQIPELIA